MVIDICNQTIKHTVSFIVGVFVWFLVKLDIWPLTSKMYVKIFYLLAAVTLGRKK